MPRTHAPLVALAGAALCLVAGAGGGAFAPRAAAAQPAPPVYDPQVAYARPGGRGTDLYLANADGSNAKKIASFRGDIGALDFSPAGNLLAFGNQEGLWTTTFLIGGNGITAGAPRLLAAGGSAPDFSEDGQRLLYRDEASNTVRAMPSGGGTPVTLFTGLCRSPRWLRSVDLGNAFACWRNVSGTPMVYEIWTVLLDANDQVVSAGPTISTRSQPFTVIDDRFDVLRTRNAVLLTTDAPVYPTLVEVRLTDGAATARGPGTHGHLAAGDVRLVSVTPHRASGDFVKALDLSTNVETMLTRRGDFGAIDAQP